MRMRSAASQIVGAREDLRILSRMLLAYMSGEYRRIPWRALGMIAGAIAYVIMPLDLIPDFILGLGLLDDATVVYFALGAIRREIAVFKRWEELRGRTGGARPASIGTPTGSEPRAPLS